MVVVFPKECVFRLMVISMLAYQLCSLIISNGRIGVGIAAPAHNLEIKMMQISVQLFIHNTTNDALVFSTNAAERLTIDSAGRCFC